MCKCLNSADERLLSHTLMTDPVLFQVTQHEKVDLMDRLLDCENGLLPVRFKRQKSLKLSDTEKIFKGAISQG